MDNIAMLFLCLAVGMALRKFGRVPDNAHVTINGFIVNVALPALILQQIHNVKLDPLWKDRRPNRLSGRLHHCGTAIGSAMDALPRSPQ